MDYIDKLQDLFENDNGQSLATRFDRLLCFLIEREQERLERDPLYLAGKKFEEARKSSLDETLGEPLTGTGAHERAKRALARQNFLQMLADTIRRIRPKLETALSKDVAQNSSIWAGLYDIDSILRKLDDLPKE